MDILKTEQPMFPKELTWPADMIRFGTDTLSSFAPFPQNAPHAASDPTVENRKRPLMAMFEILRPSLYQLQQESIPYKKRFAMQMAPGTSLRVTNETVQGEKRSGHSRQAKRDPESISLLPFPHRDSVVMSA